MSMWYKHIKYWNQIINVIKKLKNNGNSTKLYLNVDEDILNNNFNWARWSAVVWKNDKISMTE